jgi:hypothetical protein
MPAFTREFPLDPDILGQGSAVNLAVDAPGSPAAAAAIAANRPFPDGPIALGQISVGAGTGSGLVFKSGAATVSFTSSAEIQAGIGIFDSPAEAVASFALPSAKNLDLSMPQGAGAAPARWAAMRWAYSVTGNVSGAYPIGLVGGASVGVAASRAGVYGVVHCFDSGAGARDVLAATSKSWRLPRQVNFDGADVNMAPHTWLVAEVDGSLALTVGARLGYEVSFSRETVSTRDLGATIDAKLKATFGVTASGSYLLMIGRESEARTVRLRLHKHSKSGLDFALNLDVGLTGTVPLPDTFDDFVDTVFGVHGPQVVRDLHVLEQWTDPKADLGENVARLTTKTGLDLLRKTTGLDPEAKFDEAKGVVLGVLKKWDALPPGLAATTWQFLSKRTPADDAQKFKSFLETLAGGEAGKKTQALSSALGQVLADKPELKWLQAIADRGILAVAQDLDRVSALASATLAVLNGDVLKRLHDFIGDSLDLGTIRQAAQDADFGALNEWLVGRLGDLIDEKTAGIEQLKQVQKAVFAVDRKVKDVYETGIEALTKRYAAEFAATYQRTTAGTALLDVTFDLSLPKSLALFRSVVEKGDLSQLLVTEIEGVTLNNAALSHELGRTTHVELRLPFWSKDVTHVTESIASLSVEEHAGRVLVYEFSASDKVTTSNRARSELSVLGSLRAAPGGGAPIVASGTVAYEARQVAKGMRALDFERRTRPFLETYLSGLFPDGETSLEAFYGEVRPGGAGGEDALRTVVGDVALSMQVTYPAGVLASWLLPRDDAAVRADGMKLSRSVQVNLRRLIARTHFENIDNLEFNESVAALLVWTSMPVSTSIGRNLDPVRFNTDRGFFWDYADREMRFAVARDPHTGTALGAVLADAYARLRAAGKPNADLFRPARAGQFVQMALGQMGDEYLFSLLNAESRIVSGATDALRKIAAAVAAAATVPTTAVKTLSEFAGTLVDTFNGRLQFLYTPEAVRTLGPTILAEASAAIHPSAEAVRPGAMLTVYVLGPGHAFALNDFLKGALPPATEVAAAQTLVNL